MDEHARQLNDLHNSNCWLERSDWSLESVVRAEKVVEVHYDMYAAIQNAMKNPSET